LVRERAVRIELDLQPAIRTPLHPRCEPDAHLPLRAPDPERQTHFEGVVFRSCGDGDPGARCCKCCKRTAANLATHRPRAVRQAVPNTLRTGTRWKIPVGLTPGDGTTFSTGTVCRSTGCRHAACGTCRRGRIRLQVRARPPHRTPA